MTTLPEAAQDVVATARRLRTGSIPTALHAAVDALAVAYAAEAWPVARQHGYAVHRARDDWRIACMGVNDPIKDVFARHDLVRPTADLLTYGNACPNCDWGL